MKSPSLRPWQFVCGTQHTRLEAFIYELIYKNLTLSKCNQKTVGDEPCLISITDILSHICVFFFCIFVTIWFIHQLKLISYKKLSCIPVWDISSICRNVAISWITNNEFNTDVYKIDKPNVPRIIIIPSPIIDIIMIGFLPK